MKTELNLNLILSFTGNINGHEDFIISRVLLALSQMATTQGFTPTEFQQFSHRQEDGAYTQTIILTDGKHTYSDTI